MFKHCKPEIMCINRVKYFIFWIQTTVCSCVCYLYCNCICYMLLYCEKECNILVTEESVEQTTIKIIK